MKAIRIENKSITNPELAEYMLIYTDDRHKTYKRVSTLSRTRKEAIKNIKAYNKKIVITDIWRCI